MKQKILLIEDDDASRLGIVRSLSQKGFAVSVANNLANAEEDVLARRFDAVILGINQFDGRGCDFIRGVRLYDSHLPIVVITGGEQIEVAVDAVRCGADNVLAKPVDLEGLGSALDSLLEADTRQAEHADPQPAGQREEHFFGCGPGSRKFLDCIAQAAAVDVPVLIAGETGTGKGLVAKWIHRNSKHACGPWVTLNCSGLRGEVLRTELFGSKTAESGKLGLVAQASGGTLFLDEIGDMDLAVQAELLRVFKAHKAEPRLICASNHQLDALADAGFFLPELLYFISGRVVRTPPLRERLKELPDLVRRILDELRGPSAQISEDALRSLKAYRWPGNLRELRNALEQGLIRSHGARLQPEHFQWLGLGSRARDLSVSLTMNEVKERHIAAVLQRSSGDVNQVAASLGISRATMYRRLKQLRTQQR
jgi:DNA-binding NtrC family response regulator